jgi:WD40 repeat protein
MLHKFALHKVKVEALAFSPTAKYLASLGGEDDNYIVVWDIETGKAMCGAPATKDSTGPSLCLKFSNKNDHVFISGGHSHIRMWEINPEQRRIHPTECQTGQIKRIVECITVDANDEYAYCGTTTGDFVVIHMKSQLLKQTVPHKAQVIHDYSHKIRSSLEKEF